MMIDSKEKENIYNCLRKLKKEGYTIIFIKPILISILNKTKEIEKTLISKAYM